jgi:hypothetical protein
LSSLLNFVTQLQLVLAAMSFSRRWLWMGSLSSARAAAFAGIKPAYFEPWREMSQTLPQAQPRRLGPIRASYAHSHQQGIARHAGAH